MIGNSPSSATYLHLKAPNHVTLKRLHLSIYFYFLFIIYLPSGLININNRLVIVPFSEEGVGQIQDSRLCISPCDRHTTYYKSFIETKVVMETLTQSITTHTESSCGNSLTGSLLKSSGTKKQNLAIHIPRDF